MFFVLFKGSIKSERVSPSAYLNQSQNSAFKPIYHHHHHHHHSSDRSITPELKRKIPKTLLNNTDTTSSPINSSTTTATTSLTTSTTTTASSLMHPFYIDKIFNFQNMFLFSNNGNSAGNAVGGLDCTSSNNNLLTSASTSTSSVSNATPSTNEIQQLMHQQNLLQNVYNYYNSSSLLINNIENKIKNSGEQTSGKINGNGNKTTTNGNSSSKLNSNSFSIDNILSTNRSESKNQQQNIKTSQNNFDYWTLFAAHQYFSHMRTQAQLQGNSNNNDNFQQLNYSTAFTGGGGLFNNQDLIANNSVNGGRSNQIDVKLLNANNGNNLTAKTYASTAPKIPATGSIISLTTTTQANNNGGLKLNVEKSKFELKDQPVKSKNAKKYKCDLCGRGFSRSNTLITHRVS